MNYLKTAIILLICFIGCSGCIRYRYVPIEKESVSYRFKTLRDSIYFHDSVYMEIKGDTVYKEKISYRYRDSFVKDTIHIKDSIPYPVEVIKEKIVKENKTPLWCYLLISVMIIFVFGKNKLLRFFR